jgi:hypothetical protein
MSTDTRELSDKIDRKIKIYNIWTYLLWIAAAILVATFSVTMFVSITEVRKQTDLLVSCTTPTGQCYKSGDRRQSGAVQLITDTQKKIVTAAAYCAKLPGNTTLAQIEDCTNKELQK